MKRLDTLCTSSKFIANKSHTVVIIVMQQAETPIHLKYITNIVTILNVSSAVTVMIANFRGASYILENVSQQYLYP